ncbi:MAG: right-handed parallel beta-helix repeat-containing protein, partial [Candidatus Cloacimonetes bacterium]|nr:right-handed parallel beta-helix repeat-containing protein [Candidatus Cloacimonadota bacterium]
HVNGSSINVFHNSVLSTSMDAYYSYAAGIYGSYMTVRKNHFVCLGEATPLYAYNVAAGTTGRNIIEHNNIYTNFNNVAKVQNDLYREISDFNGYTELQNESCDPFFSTSGLLTVSPWLDNKYPSCTPEVATDFNGNPRSSTYSDIGAHEYTSDIGLTPMSGTRNIGIGGDYTTIGAFLSAITLRGLGGNMIGRLTDASYNEQLVLGSIPGSAGDRTLKLESELDDGSVIINPAQSSNSNFVLKLNRVAYVTFRKLRFQSAQAASSNLVILNGYNNMLQFWYCHFDAPLNAAGQSIANDYRSKSSNITVFSCQFTGNGYGITGSGTDWLVMSNGFENTNNSVYFTTVSDCNINANAFSGFAGSAIYISGGTEITIRENRIQNLGIMQSKGITLYNASYSGGTRCLIANNTIKINASSCTGINIGGNGINTINNSVQVTGVNSQAFYCYELGSYNDIVNNIFVVDQGYAVEISSYTAAADKVIDYNCYYNEGSAFVKLGSVYNSLSTWQAACPTLNQHSLSLNPHFTADLHSGSAWLREAGLVRSETPEDIDGDSRGTSYDIGADQQTGALVDTRMAGTYSVGAIGNNFSSIEAAIAAIELNGISAPVVINITLGTYTGYYTMHEYPKANPSYGVSFVAWEGSSFVLNPTFDTSAENFFFHLVGADRLSFSGFNLSRQTNNKPSSFFFLDGRCDNISITACNFALAGSSNNTATAINTSTSEGSYLSVTDCTFTNGYAGLIVTGSYYGTISYTNLAVSGCTFTGTNNPISVQKAVNLNITHNQFAANTQALSLSYITGTSLVTYNKIRSSGFGSVTCVSLSNCNGSAAIPFQLVNNLIYTDQNSAQAVVAMSIGNSSYINMNHNTLISDNVTSNEYGGALVLASVSNSKFKNSIFSAPQSGYAVTIDTNSSNLEFYSNAYYNSARYLGINGSNTYSSEDFITTQLGDLYGVFANPLPNQNGYTQCTYLRDKGNGVELTTDIDGNSFGAISDIGATLVPNFGAAFSGIIEVGLGKQFTTLDAALEALMQRGISADVTLQVAGGEQSLSATLGYIPNSLQYSVSITGATVGNAPIFVNTATTEADNYILKLYNTSKLSLSNLAFRMNTPAFSKCLDVQRFTRNFSIDNCTFSTYPNTQTSQSSAAVYAANAIITGFTINDSNIINNPAGVYVYNSNSAELLNTGFEFTNNTLTNVATAISLSNLSAPEVVGNTVDNFRSTGIYANNCSDLFISANTITGNGNSGINLNNLRAGIAVHKVFNNYVRTGVSTPSSLNLTNSPNVQVFYNTLVIANPSTNSQAFIQNASSAGLEFRNNICKAAGGYAAKFNQLSDLTARDHNLYYSTGATTVLLGSTPINSSLVWNQNTGDQYSRFADPLLDGDTYNLTAGSPARNAGISISVVTSDITGILRGDSPDLGCKECVLSTLDTPQNIGINVNDVAHTVTLSWATVAGAGAYRVQTADDPYATVWTNVPNSTTGQLSITLPLSSTGKFFRIIAFGPE